MRRLLLRHWFLVGLALFIPGGFYLGASRSTEEIEAFRHATGSWMSLGCTTTILFLMSVTLNTGRLAAALRAPRAALWAALINAGFIPLLAWPMTRLQRIDDFKIGVMIAASVPCTMAAASVWTRAAGGNDAVSLLVTTLTNGLCFLITPFWLGLATQRDLNLSASDMVLPLLFGGFAPIVAGQLVRLIPKASRFADREKLRLSMLAQVCILAQVLWACVIAGPRIREGVQAGNGWTAAGIAWGSCVALHVAGLIVAWFGAGPLGVQRDDRIAAVFAGSQKTLPIGLLIAMDPRLLGDSKLRFAMLPMLMYHASQLIIDTVVAARLSAGNERLRTVPPEQTAFAGAVAESSNGATGS